MKRIGVGLCPGGDRKLNPLALALRSLIRGSLFEMSWVATLVKGVALSTKFLPGGRDELFEMLGLFRKVRLYTWVGVPRLEVLYRLGRAINNPLSVAGDIVECGVYNGGSAGVMAYAGMLQSRFPRHVWLFDSFSGLPRPSDQDEVAAWKWVGECKGDQRKVEELFRDLNIPRSRVHVVKGWFESTFPEAGVEIKQISLLHLDVDWYKSTKLCLEHFYEKVVPGGFVVIDDYGYWKGCRRAVNDFITGRDLKLKLIRVGYFGCYFQKV